MKYIFWLAGIGFTLGFMNGFYGEYIAPVRYEGGFVDSTFLIIAWPLFLGVLLGQIVRASGIVL